MMRLLFELFCKLLTNSVAQNILFAMKDVTYKTTGTCAKVIHFTKNDDGTITNVSFEGGCDGNLKAISKLVNGMSAQQIHDTLIGNLCRSKGTSCADQLAKAVMSE